MRFPLILLGKRPVIERIIEYNRSVELGDSTAAERDQRSVVDGPDARTDVPSIEPHA
jgi:hypothetical protein